MLLLEAAKTVHLDSSLETVDRFKMAFVELQLRTVTLEMKSNSVKLNVINASHVKQHMCSMLVPTLAPDHKYSAHAIKVMIQLIIDASIANLVN